MSEEIQPALTEEEWSERRYEFLSEPALAIQDDGDGLEVVVYPNAPARSSRRPVLEKYKIAQWAPEDYRAVTALAARGAGPDGGPLFTWEMVDRIRWAAGIVELNILGPGYDENARHLSGLHAAASALASLLPPRKES